MSGFFNGWRRKWGILTLAIALLFAVGWARSLVVDEFIDFPFDDDSLSGLETQDQSLAVYWFSRAQETDTERPSSSTEPTSDVSTNPDTEPTPTAIEVAIPTFDAPEADGSTDEWIVVGSGSIRSHTTVISCSFPSPEPRFRIPFSLIVIPLTLLSAWLLIWNRK